MLQDGATSLLEATANKQGESDGDQDGALSDGSLLASSTDQVRHTSTTCRSLPLRTVPKCCNCVSCFQEHCTQHKRSG